MLVDSHLGGSVLFAELQHTHKIVFRCFVKTHYQHQDIMSMQIESFLIRLNKSLPRVIISQEDFCGRIAKFFPCNHLQTDVTES